MNWRLLYTEANTGKYNMDTDVFFAENMNENEIVLRFYKWNPYCISLGANQNVEEIDIKKVNEDGIDLVKRPTGGRAVLHAEELTYSIIFPSGFLTPRKIYNEVNFAIKKGLVIYNSKLECIELENENADFASFYESNLSSACFSVSAKSELKFNGKKLVGSAQRKFKNSILQHGSILCGEFHKRITDYLNLSLTEKEQVKLEIQNKTIDLSKILKEEVNYEKLMLSLTKGFKDYFDCSFSYYNEPNINLGKALV